MAPSNTNNRKNVLPDLSQQKTKQAEEALARLLGDKTKGKKKYEGSPYEAPTVHPYKIKIGKNAGKIGWVIRFEHKANPAWSISIKLSAAQAIKEFLDEFLACIPALAKQVNGDTDEGEE